MVDLEKLEAALSPFVSGVSMPDAQKKLHRAARATFASIMEQIAEPTPEMLDAAMTADPEAMVNPQWRAAAKSAFVKKLRAMLAKLKEESSAG